METWEVLTREFKAQLLTWINSAQGTKLPYAEAKSALYTEDDYQKIISSLGITPDTSDGQTVAFNHGDLVSRLDTRNRLKGELSAMENQMGFLETRFGSKPPEYLETEKQHTKEAGYVLNMRRLVANSPEVKDKIDNYLKENDKEYRILKLHNEDIERVYAMLTHVQYLIGFMQIELEKMTSNKQTVDAQEMRLMEMVKGFNAPDWGKTLDELTAGIEKSKTAPSPEPANPSDMAAYLQGDNLVKVMTGLTIAIGKTDTSLNDLNAETAEINNHTFAFVGRPAMPIVPLVAETWDYLHRIAEALDLVAARDELIRVLPHMSKQTEKAKELRDTSKGILDAYIRSVANNSISINS